MLLIPAYLPDALATECAKCSEVQKKQAGKVFSHLLQNHRQYFDELLAKYDPDGNFRKKYHVDEDVDYEYEDWSFCFYSFCILYVEKYIFNCII